jgi:biopolymer transport protein ExbD
MVIIIFLLVTASLRRATSGRRGNFHNCYSVQEAEENIMAILLGGQDQKAEINVTPMIDVLLVLIIIFLVVTPLKPLGLNALVPQPSPPEPAVSQDVVITVGRDGNIRLNQEPVTLPGLRDRLVGIFGSSPSRVLFVRGERDLDFRQIVEVLDIAHGAGLYRVALMTQ